MFRNLLSLSLRSSSAAFLSVISMMIPRTPTGRPSIRKSTAWKRMGKVEPSFRTAVYSTAPGSSPSSLSRRDASALFTMLRDKHVEAVEPSLEVLAGLYPNISKARRFA